MGSIYGSHCLGCNNIEEEGGVVKDKFPVRAPDGVNRNGCNRNLERGGNGRRKPSTSEKPGNIRNRPRRTQLLQFTIDFSNNELDLKHYMLGGSDIAAFFRQYQNGADKILKPIMLETNVQELLALGD
ncbi:hypothetical protein J3Q64DRAFT_1846612, partial [Phycomyces blakesleeanus]